LEDQAEYNKQQSLIFKKILDIQEEIPVILKNREFKDKQGRTMYKFRGVDDLYNALHPLFRKYRVFMTPEVLESQRSERKSSSGGILFSVILKIKYELITEDGSSINAIVQGEAMDSGDKATNKAMSVAQKYALIQIFQVPTDEKKDPENNRHEIIPEEQKEEIDELMILLEKCKTADEVQKLWKEPFVRKFDKNEEIKKKFIETGKALVNVLE